MRNKFRVYYLGVLLIALLGLNSCSNDGYSLGKFWVNWVTVLDEDGHAFLRDDGKTLWATNINSPGKPKNKRVILHYTILGDNFGKYDYAIKLNGYVADVLTKDIIYLAEDDEEGQESVGHDPIRIDNVFVGGGYLNIEYSVLSSSGALHHLNMVSSEADFGITKDVIELEFRQKQEKGTPSYLAYNLVSFDLAELRERAEDGQELNIKILWLEAEAKYGERTVKYTVKKEETPPVEEVE